MRRLLYRILLFSGFFAIFLLVFMALIAYSTKYSPAVEKYLFPQPGLWGGTYQRSQELDVWLKNTENDSLSGLLLGGSTVYRNIDPYILSEKTGIDFFNAGSNSQALANSLVLLQHCVNSGKPIQYLVVSVDHVLWDNSGLESSSDWITNNHNPSAGYTFNMAAIARTHLLWLSYAYLRVKQYVPGSYIYVDTTLRGEVYAGKGFVCSSDQTPRKLEVKVPIPEMSPKNYNALLEIMRICKERNITLTFFNPKLLNAEYDVSVIKQLDGKILDAATAPVDAALFYDNYHLYCRGTALYTEWIADEFIQLHHITPTTL